MKEDKYLYILLHPPRTGGESLTTFIEDHFSKDESLRIDNFDLSSLSEKQKKKIKFLAGHTTYFGIHKLFPNKIPRYITLLRDPARMLVSLYHSRMDDFPKKRKQTFEEWYSLRKRNETTFFYDGLYRSTDQKVVLSNKIKRRLREKILLNLDKSKRIHVLLQRLRRKHLSLNEQKKKLENAKKLLDECWFIFITEKLKDDLKYLFKLMRKKMDLKKFKIKSNTKRKLFTLDEKTRKKIYAENPLDFKLYKHAMQLNKVRKSKIK